MHLIRQASCELLQVHTLSSPHEEPETPVLNART